MKKFFVSLFLFLFLFSCGKKEKTIEIDNENNLSDNITEEAPVEQKKIITITAVGDIMLGSNYPSDSSLPPGNENILKDVEIYLKDSDITFGNLEGTLFDSGGNPKSCSDPSVCYVFRTPSSFGQYLSDAGFDVMSIANNHNGDFGPVGRAETKENLDKLGIKYAGLLGTDEFIIFEKEGIKYGFAAFAPNNGTVSINDIPYAEKIVKQLKENSDIVIISFHGGAEGDQFQHVPKRNEIFFGENRGDVHDFARKMVDAGADIVFGHGPHVIRAVELYNDKFISYSSGNFATYGNFSLTGVKGISPIFKIKLDENGNFVEGQIISTYQVKGSGPKIDPKNRALQKIIELTESDFPDTSLSFTSKGTITKNK